MTSAAPLNIGRHERSIRALPGDFDRSMRFCRTSIPSRALKFKFYLVNSPPRHRPDSEILNSNLAKLSYFAEPQI